MTQIVKEKITIKTSMMYLPTNASCMSLLALTSIEPNGQEPFSSFLSMPHTAVAPVDPVLGNDGAGAAWSIVGKINFDLIG